MAAPSRAEELADKLFEKKDEEKQQKKRQRRCTYLLIQWGLQIFCAILAFLLVLWATIQFLRVFDFIGVGATPPGLEHAVVDPN